MKKLLFVGACLVALASQPVVAQSLKPDEISVQLTEPDVIVVRVSDVGINPHLVIVRADGKGEEVELANGSSTKNLTASGGAMQRAFAKLYQEGYALKSTFAGYQGTTSTLIFVKEK